MLTTISPKIGMPLLRASIFALLLFKVCSSFLRSYTQINLEENGYSPILAKDLSWFLIPAVLGVLMFPILRQNWSNLRNLFRVESLTWRLVLASIALGITLRIAFLSGLVSKAAFHLFTPSTLDVVEYPLFSFLCPPPFALGLTIVVTAIFIPLVEETMNRGFILNVLLPRGKWLAIAVSAVLFGIFHAPHMIFPATVAGLFLAAQCLNAKTLWAPIISHATVNLLNTADAVCSQVIWNPAADAATTGSVAFVIMIVSLMASGILARHHWYIQRSGR